MSELDVTRGQKLYAEASAIVAEEVPLKKKSDRHIVRLASILRDLYDVFQRREDPNRPLVLVPRTKGFADFRECMIELLRPLDLGERTGWYYLSIGRRLLRVIPEADLEGVSLEKVKILDRVAKAKQEVPAHLIERAKNQREPASALREEVDIMLYRGFPDHSDGPKRCLRLVAGSKLIHAIEEKIEKLRPAVTEEGASMPASAAQVWTSPWPTVWLASRKRKTTPSTS